MNSVFYVYEKEGLPFKDTDKLRYVITLKNQYSMDILADLLEYGNVCLRNILKSQKGLSVDFCKKYILNEDYAFDVEETYIDISDCIKYQPHLKYSDFSDLWNMLLVLKQGSF